MCIYLKGGDFKKLYIMASVSIRVYINWNIVFFATLHFHFSIPKVGNGYELLSKARKFNPVTFFKL